MAISKEQWEARFKAALELRGMDLKDFPEELEGFPKRAAVRALHPSDTYLATRPLARSVAEELGLPEEWFTAEDFSEVFATGPAEGVETRLAELERVGERVVESLSLLLGGQTAIHDDLQALKAAQQKRGQSSGASGNG